jgi:hypothetical protein
MKAIALAIVSVGITALSASGQIPKPGFGDKGCPEKSLFAENVSISDEDFLEVHQLPSYSNGPVYTVRLYGDGRLVWHGEKVVNSVGDASDNINVAQAKALIAEARHRGFGGLCDEYVMRGFDGGISVTTLRIGGQVKVVSNAGPSNAPSWLYKLQGQIAALNSVSKLIGVKQTKSAVSKLKLLPMPQDRVADSYVIYSQLLPGDEIEWGNVQRSFWLMEDTTKAEPPDSSCAIGGIMNPHKAIQAPEPRQADFAEVLADFDAHCHDQYLLDASQFHEKLPVRLLDEEARKRFVSHVAGYMPPQNDIMRAPPTPDEFKGAAGMHSFTAVYFNREHTLAMTEIGMFCGGLCGNWRWVVLERKDEQWKTLPWVRMTMMS